MLHPMTCLRLIRQYLSFTGVDGGKAEWVKVHTDDNHTIQCKFKRFLDNYDEDTGKECKMYEDASVKICGIIYCPTS